MLRRHGLALSAWILVAAPVAAAQDRPIEDAVSIARAGACLEAAPLAEHLRAWLRRDRVDARLAVVVEETEHGAALVILRDGAPSAARRFDALPTACADRRAAVALAIALAIDAAVLDELVPERAPPVAATPASPSPEAPTPSTPFARLELAAEAQLLLEVLPEVAAGWQIGARVVLDRTVEVGLAAMVTSVAGADLQPGRVDAQLVGARVDACLRREDDVTLRGCLGVAGGAGRGQGRDLPSARESLVPYFGLLGRLGVAIRLHDALALEIAADAWVALVRPRFDYLAGGEITASATLPIAGGSGSLGLAVRF